MLTARVDNLQKALDQANQQLGQMTNVSPSGPSAKDMQDRIDRLEKQLADMHRPQSAPTRAASVALSDSEVVTVAPAKAAAHKHKTAKPVAHKAKPAKKAHQVAAKESAPSSWILRAAVPGQAWVASDATSHDLKQVQVGDTLTGIGRITAIQQQGDQWIVKGSKGSIQ
jgi:hypothetical protein